MKYEKKYYEYLDGLRESGVTKMFGAAPYLQGTFRELTTKKARKVVVDWMKTFGQREEVKKQEVESRLEKARSINVEPIYMGRIVEKEK